MSTRCLVVSTIGTSLLSSHVEYLSDEQKKARPRIVTELANAQKLSAEETAIINDITAHVRKTLLEDDSRTIRRKSAELNGIYALYKNQLGQRTQDMHMLIATDTELGRRSAELVKSHLHEQHGISTITYTPSGLTTANTTEFEAGSKDLIHWCSKNIPPYREDGYTVIFNLVGAFKSLQGYLNIIGMFYADQILYLFEGPGSEPILIPRLPIKIDIDVLKPFAVQLALMAEGGADLPVAELEDLSRALFDSVDERAMISDWGALVWNQARETLLGGDLLTFPRLSYRGSFQKDFRSNKDLEQRVELQSALAKVSALLEQSNGNRAKLRDHGGLQYGTYKNHPTIDHFRVSLSHRVNCQAEDGGLTLLNFGSHDYCERDCLR